MAPMPIGDVVLTVSVMTAALAEPLASAAPTSCRTPNREGGTMSTVAKLLARSTKIETALSLLGPVIPWPKASNGEAFRRLARRDAVVVGGREGQGN